MAAIAGFLRRATGGRHNVRMANIASVLKAEITRVARKQARAEVEMLRKASAQHRGAIAALRREVALLRKELRTARRRLAAGGGAAPAVADGGAPARRFSASRLSAHRAKLALSAADYGRLVGMSGATIYNWEQGKSRPNADQLNKLAAARRLSRRGALEYLAQA